MTNYAQLIQDLRDPRCGDGTTTHIIMRKQAADAIEELQKVANKLLVKYQDEASSVIWEYSGNINEDIVCLDEEVRTLMAQINGMQLPEPPKEED